MADNGSTAGYPLADVAVGVMRRLLRSLGDPITTLPAARIEVFERWANTGQRR